MCAPCKIILNSGGVVGTLKAMEKALEHLNKRGYDIPEDVHREGVELICGFHDKLREYEKKIAEGPYVPFEKKIISNISNAKPTKT